MQKASVVVWEVILILLAIMSRLLRPHYRMCYSDFVGYNIKVVEALLPHPSLPPLHIYRPSEGVSEWHTSPAHVINMTLRHKWVRFDHSAHLTSLFASHPIHPSATLCTSHIWTSSLPSLPPSSVSLLNAAMAHIQIHHSAQSAAAVDPSVRPSDYHNKGARVWGMTFTQSVRKSAVMQGRGRRMPQ